MPSSAEAVLLSPASSAALKRRQCSHVSTYMASPIDWFSGRHDQLGQAVGCLGYMACPEHAGIVVSDKSGADKQK